MPDPASVRLTDGVRLHVDVSGPETAPLTVVLLHGWTLDGRTWHRQVDALRQRYGDAVRVVRYDARGHGRSGPSTLGTATLDQLGDDLAEVLAQVAPTGPVVLAGHSMGGMTVMEYAHRHSADFARRVAGLVLVATTAEGHTHTCYGVPPPLARLIRIAETGCAGVLARFGGWRTPPPLLNVLRPTLRWLLFGDDCDPADIRLTTSAVARASLVSIGGFRPSIGAQRRLETLTALGDLPVAALVGDRDRLTPPPCTVSITEALPSAELTICPGAGHMLMLERPDEVTAALYSVVDRVRPVRRISRKTAATANRRRRAGTVAEQPRRAGATHGAPRPASGTADLRAGAAGR
ncbi:alpha/beta hydrolase [Micromonospora sp. WMMD1102]|uniref:alpha/beta fold hydrolase n=1 Tax=Micromonospora sp. WMMD1102 TaxID=3016105 RepID=UPI0024157221|nr:alpha/beta hydrolase [Micromonospora sp. WMMD1102]MDG4789050.1 alpha/beta hydrolase [Micromonospora sp. WMMD1102]